MPRKALSARTRFEIFKRDLFTCQYCGSRPPEAILQVDHIEPVVGGGSDHLSNLITACRLCNLGKSASDIFYLPQHHILMRDRDETLDQYACMTARKLYDFHNQAAWSTTRKFMQYLPWDDVDECMDAAIVLSESRLPDDIFNVFREFCMDKVKSIEDTCQESVQ